jgi:hypothetical protein
MEAAVYNTLGLNDCPDDLWRQLDPERIKHDHHARAVILNGPRYFLMDRTDIESEVQSEPVTFGPLQMRHVATLRLPLLSLLGGQQRKPYAENIVERTTTYTFDTGRDVFELASPEGDTYIMQSYSLQVDSALTEVGLSQLGQRLQVPQGWRFRVRQLEAPFIVTAVGKAHVIQDELENTYQRVV